MLAQYLPVAPLLLVLCVFIMELLVGGLIVAGIAVRFAAIMILLTNVASFVVFREQLWPHIWLIGGALVIFAHGYDTYTLENRLKPYIKRTVDWGSRQLSSVRRGA
jgi:uncharacterized membrane protein YphA (DoxX/SURF4 family)